MTHFSHIANAIATDNLEMQAAMTSVIMVSTKFSRSNPVAAQKAFW